ncbi:MAG TPA: hypothetical protein VL086_13505 [Candidatus Nitrosotalea sp.]|nr:hypothetical protein [Candidatus Nitrosotalea sp.]
MTRDLPFVLARLGWMREQRTWPNGLRYLWTDAFGVVLLVSLYRVLGDERYLDQAEWVVAEVDRVLGRPVGIRIGEAPDRDGQYFHYLAMWLFALGRLGAVRHRHHDRAVALVRAIHPRFVVRGMGVTWKMREDLSGPYPGYGFGALDAFHGYVVYRLLDPGDLAGPIGEMQELVEASYRALHITQDLGLGMMLWLSHFFPDEPWAVVQRGRALATLESMWVDPPGYFCRAPGQRHVRFAFTNYGVSIGLQAVGARMDRVDRLNAYFSGYRSHDDYDTDAITHVMACASLLPGELIARP